MQISFSLDFSLFFVFFCFTSHLFLLAPILFSPNPLPSFFPFFRFTWQTDWSAASDSRVREDERACLPRRHRPSLTSRLYTNLYTNNTRTATASRASKATSQRTREPIQPIAQNRRQQRSGATHTDVAEINTFKIQRSTGRQQALRHPSIFSFPISSSLFLFSFCYPFKLCLHIFTDRCCFFFSSRFLFLFPSFLPRFLPSFLPSSCFPFWYIIKPGWCCLP